MTPSTLYDGDLRLLEAMPDMPLATAEDLAWAVRAPNTKGVYPRLQRLEENHLVQSVTLGFLEPRVSRYWLADEGQSRLRITDGSWHQYAGLTRLLERVGALEWLYPAAARLDDMGQFLEFQWVDGGAFDAAVLYQSGWAVLIWAGLLFSESTITQQLMDLGRDLEKLACGDPHPRPGRIVVLTTDQFGAELVLRVAGRLRMVDWVSVWSIGDDTWHGARRSLPSRGWVYQPVYRRTTGQAGWERRVRESWWTEEGNRNPSVLLGRVKPALGAAMGDRHQADALVRRLRRDLRGLAQPADATQVLRQAEADLEERAGLPEAAAILGRTARYLEDPDPAADAARIMLAAVQWLGMSTGMARAALREPSGGRRAQRVLLRLRDWGLLQRRKRRKSLRYWPTRELVKEWARLDRTDKDDAWELIGMDAWDAGRVSEEHDFGVMDAMTPFLAAGCPAANGWRDYEALGASGGIVPDAIVRLERSPFMPDWAYWEHERSATSPDPVGRKLRGFDSPFRPTGWPVLVACLNDQAERVFHAVGERMGIRMLTTTMERLRKFGPIGNADCWRLPEYLRNRRGGSLPPGEPPILG